MYGMNIAFLEDYDFLSLMILLLFPPLFLSGAEDE